MDLMQHDNLDGIIMTVHGDNGVSADYNSYSNLN